MDIPREKLDTTIEDADLHGLEAQAAIAERLIDDLTRAQLLALLPYVHIDYGDNGRVDTGELRRVMGEATWADFIQGYRVVTGQDPSAAKRT